MLKKVSNCAQTCISRFPWMIPPLLQTSHRATYLWSQRQQLIPSSSGTRLQR